MKFATPLVPGKLIKRYMRFLADVELESGEVVTAHCTSTGSLLGLKDPGSPVLLSHASNPDRKLKYTWEMVEVEGTLVGVNTSHPNNLVEEAVRSGLLPAFKDYPTLRREVKYGKNSRIDLLLSGGNQPDCYIEVKNCHLKRNGRAEFPDAVTERGAKHLEEMMAMVDQGHRAAMVYVIQRGDCEHFAFAEDIDPHYAATAATAFAKGVEAYASVCHMSAEGIEITGKLLKIGNK